jgi:hypothetical protein
LPFPSNLVKYLRAKLEPIRVEPLTGLHYNVWFLAVLTNSRLEWKGMAVANTLAYYNAATITGVKVLLFMVLKRR